MSGLRQLLQSAVARRKDLIRDLIQSNTNCWRIFHGIAEGRPGLTVDRFGALVLAQTFREPLNVEEVADLEQSVRDLLQIDFSFVYNHRDCSLSGERPYSMYHSVADAALQPVTCTENGIKVEITPRHAGSDPHLFLDLRNVRSWVLHHAAGRSVLNLFSYTCGVGLAAALGNATEVLNVDFSMTPLEVAQRNAQLNGLRCSFVNSTLRYEEKQQVRALPADLKLQRQQIPYAPLLLLREDVFATVWQLAGSPPKSRRGRLPSLVKLSPRAYDLGVLDPPKYLKGKYQVVDVVKDYGSLFRPAARIVSSGGVVLAVNHSPDVAMDAWKKSLQR